MPIIASYTKEHSFLERPALGDPLWRYMDFTKFLSMLVNSGLYMSRLDNLGDKYEGWIPNSPKYGGFFKKEWEERDRELKKSSLKERKRYYVNCWHANDEQSDAMWKLYTKGNDGIAIRTTCKNLRDSLKDAPEELWIHKVIYSSSEREPIHGGSMLRACLTKRLPFEHEKEIRIIWYKNKEVESSFRKNSRKSAGFYVQCDLETLIEQIFIAPTEKPWLAPLIKDVLLKYGIKAKVIQSGLNMSPP